MIAGIIAIISLPGWFFCASNDYFSGYGLLIGMIITFWFEEKFVNFDNTSKPIVGIIRTIVGVVVFLAVTNILKLPFSDELLDGQTFIAHLIRSARYAIAIFVAMGLYPMIFKVIGKKK